MAAILVCMFLSMLVGKMEFEAARFLPAAG
jgi:hypothetical protein